ncbi:MAG: C1 family peptidase [Acidobacteria bacterium]|nr:C1 family peptidase [Acidobacteriota bacterium]
MRRGTLVGMAVACAGLMVVPVGAQETHRDHVKYVKPYRDPVLKEMIERDKKLRREAEKKTAEIVKELKAQKRKEREERPRLRFDTSGIEHPAGPDDFQQVWHFPPVAQYLSGTCWDFSTTSFMESEIKRLTGQEIKLSEMWTAYWEYVNKAKGYIETRGHSEFGQGSETNALTRVYSEHGVVPEAAYKGVLAEDGRVDHSAMERHMKGLLEWCKDNNYWDEDFIVSAIRKIMDETMGRPPENVTWQGATYTPKEFLTKVCQLHPDDYVSLMSTLSVPFWTHGEYRVPDNWWHDKSYVNVPLDVWYATIVNAIKAGESVVIGGDVSEPGYYGKGDIAVVPSFDIPGQFIDQDSRELRFYNHTSTDDHGIHLVGYKNLDGVDWFLIKDSARSSRWGKYSGYYMYRSDYVKLKMLTFTVHKDFIKDVLEKVAANEKKIEEAKAAEVEQPKPSGSN